METLSAPEPEIAQYVAEAPCARCQGTGKRVSPSFTSVEGKVYEERTYDCHYCKARGYFPGVDVNAIIALVFTTGNKPRFRASWPSKSNPWRSNDVTTLRAYYVWRLARFHGGADVTMPMTAISTSEGDPHVKFLDAIADYVATLVFGTSRAAAYRWANALGHDLPVPAGEPESARSGGPVVTSGEKPDFEREELK